MNGIILSNSNYTYEGNIVDNEAHGKGVFQYANGDRYVGECKFGKMDGYGKYTYRTSPTYTGFFSFGKMHGIGTFEDNINIYKGTWRNDKKHGIFYRTQKQLFQTFAQKWNKGKLVKSERIQYIQPDALRTVKDNPIRVPKKYQTSYRGTEKKCMACLDKPSNATNINCGHVMMCYECLTKCDRCPICRAPIEQIIRLFVS